MKTVHFLFGLMLGLALPSLHAGSLKIQFHPTESYRDLGRDERERADALKALQAHLESLAQRRLTATQTLDIEVLEINRAGDVEPRLHWGQDLRVLRNITWPQLSLRYSLSDAGRTLSEGRVDLSDMNYMDGLRNRYPSGDSLRYEKKMLDEWFDKALLPQASQ